LLRLIGRSEVTREFAHSGERDRCSEKPGFVFSLGDDDLDSGIRVREDTSLQLGAELSGAIVVGVE
jgi:hypothetical protein